MQHDSQLDPTPRPKPSPVLIVVLSLLSLVLIGSGVTMLVRQLHPRTTSHIEQPGQSGQTPTMPGNPSDQPSNGNQVAPPSATGGETSAPGVSPNDAVPEFTAVPTDSPIYPAAYNGNLDEVKKLLAENPKLLNACDKGQGATPLHWALAQNRNNVANFLLARGAQVNVKGKLGKTPLHIAAYSGNTAMVKALIAKGAELEACDSNDGTALLMAVGRGHMDTVEYLLSLHANVNVQEKTIGLTPLQSAIIGKQHDLVKILLTHGADPNLATNDGMSPLMAAEMTRDDALVALLKQHGAK